MVEILIMVTIVKYEEQGMPLEFDEMTLDNMTVETIEKKMLEIGLVQEEAQPQGWMMGRIS